MMLRGQYALDSASQAQDLANAILSASSSSQISSVCNSISTYLRSCPVDQTRHFFSIAFPVFICKLFGFSDSPASNSSSIAPDNVGWVNVVNQSNDPNLVSDVFTILSPSGILFQSIFSADRHSLVKYIFPVERLPEWIRFILSNDKYCHALPQLCPLFDKRLKETSDKSSPSHQVQLSIFEYFVFWFAYYPICKGNSGNSTTVVEKRSKRFRLESWTIPRLSSSKGEKTKLGSNLYLLLLYAYLKEFVPLDEAHAHRQGYRSSLLHYDNDQSGGITQERAVFFVDTLLNYWLVDNDPSPIPPNIAKYHGILTSFRVETPPSSNIGEFVKMLVEYLILCYAVRNSMTHQVHSLMPTSINNGASGSPWNPSFQRGVYRYILRTLLCCPMGSSLKNVSEVFSVWMSFLEPWKIHTDHFSGMDALIRNPDNNKADSQSNISVYSPFWETYVLSNYLFYTSMVLHFVEFSHKFLLSDPICILRMVITIVDVLYTNKELINLLKEMDTSLSCKHSGSTKSTLQKHVPLIREHLLDWEDGLSESDSNPSLFSEKEDGGHQLLQLFVLRAESAIQTIPGDNLHHLGSLKSKIINLFGLHSQETEPHTRNQEQPRDEKFTPRKFRTSATSDGTCRTDPMQRPLCDYEVQWLAKILVKLSCWANGFLGLNHSVRDGSQKVPFVEVRNCGDVCGVKGVFNVMFSALVDWTRVHGVRVNLRMLASKRLIFLFVVFIGFRSLFRMLGE